MQSLKDATVVLGVLLLLVSVKVVPLESVGDVIPSAEAASAQTDGGTALAGFVREPSDPAIEQLQIDAEIHECEFSGDRIILRIDAQEGQAQVERIDVVEPAPVPTPRNAALEACKIS